jgi:SAM-dependent methyltransferase
MTDRLEYPATLRNRDAILDVLRDVLPPSGLVLEIASGSGEHAVHFARAFPDLTFQPTDPDGDALKSIKAWAGETGLTNIRAPLLLDAASDTWPMNSADAILCINMIHIAPWRATEGLMHGAAKILLPGSPLYLYGPYRQASVITAPSNETFDASLKSRNAEWGLRNLEDVAALAAQTGFSAPEVTQMPAKNLSVVFRRI